VIGQRKERKTKVKKLKYQNATRKERTKEIRKENRKQ
jgi:hypothetical protein